MMLTRFKAWLITAGTLLLAIITLGGYARYQKRRAEKAEQEAEENQRLINQAQAIEQKTHQAKKENYNRRKQANERKANRTFFDNL